jgi:hypothetical protein
MSVTDVAHFALSPRGFELFAFVLDWIFPLSITQQQHADMPAWNLLVKPSAPIKSS